MKVAIIQESIDPGRGGAETSTVEMARRLAELGVDVTLLVGDEKTVGVTTQNPRVTSLTGGGGSKLGRTRAYLQRVADYLRTHSYDVVHAVMPCEQATVYQPRGGTYRETIERSIAPGAGALERGVRRLLRRFNFRQQYLLRTEERMLSRSNPPFVAALSDYVRRQIVDGFASFPPDRARVVFNGVDFVPLEESAQRDARQRLRAELGVSDGQSLALFVAHNFKLKGLRELLGAMATSGGRRPGWLLAVLGRDDRAPYERLAQQLHIADRVHWLAPLDVRNAYAAADVLAHPTWYDPCSRVVLEALSCGLPVVTTRFNGAAEAMIDGRHGGVIDSPENVTILADAIAKALSPTIRESCKADAAELRERLSMARHARELVALYREIAGAKAN